jgi:hypothetical protein
VCIILKFLFRKHPEILDKIGDKLAAIDLQNCKREEDIYRDNDVLKFLRNAVQKWKPNIQKECVYLIDKKWNDAQKDAIVGLGYFILPVKGCVSVDFITLLKKTFQNGTKGNPWKLSVSCISSKWV